MFKKYLKVAGTSLLAIIMALTLTGCGEKQTPEAKEMVVWGFVDEDVFKPIIRDFNSSISPIKINYIKKNFDSNYENDALNSIMSGQGPDVWAIPNDWVFRHQQKLYPMPENLIKEGKIDFTNYARVLLSDNLINKQMYGLTPGLDTLQIFYNPSLIEKGRQRAQIGLENNDKEMEDTIRIFNNLPITWDELNKIVPWITEKKGSEITTAAIALGTSNNVSESADILSLLMLQNQTKMTSDDISQASFNLPAKDSSGQDIYPGANSLSFYTSYANPANPNYSWNQSMPNDVQAFVNGKVAMIFGYSSLDKYLNQVYPNFYYQKTLVPQIGNPNQIVDYASYTTYVVPQISSVKNTAWKFVNYLSNEAYPTYISATRTISPRIIEQSGGEALKNRANSELSNEILDSLSTWNKGRYPVELDNLFKDAISRVNTGSQSPQASLDTAATKLTELLRKEDW
jgi:maltose-binding protein MalE